MKTSYKIFETEPKCFSRIPVWTRFFLKLHEDSELLRVYLKTSDKEAVALGDDSTPVYFRSEAQCIRVFVSSVTATPCSS